jgi:hypothetical protein
MAEVYSGECTVLVLDQREVLSLRYLLGRAPEDDQFHLASLCEALNVEVAR